MLPEIIKTNRQLKSGMYWPIRLQNEMFAVGIVLDIPPKETKHSMKLFFAGLIDYFSSNLPSPNDILEAKLIECGQAHIKTITETGAKVIGQIDLMSSKIIIPEMKEEAFITSNSKIVKGYKIIRRATREDTSLTTLDTWGYSVINLLAEKWYIKIGDRKST